MSQRFFIELAYNGTAYNGWQRQIDAPSVQETIERQLTKLHSGTEVPIVGCGRTDTGVHAHFFVAHAELPESTDTGQLTYKLNKMLPSDIVIFRIYPVGDELHARFSATARTYRYFIHREKSPFLDYSLHVNKDLDFAKMNEAARHLLGRQDFTSLSKLHTDVRTHICTVMKAEWHRQGDQWYFEITADRFLRNMVRATVGTLLEVGIGKLHPDDIPKILAAMTRSAAKVSVDGKALFLWDIRY